MGSATTQGRPAARAGVAGRVAFRSGDGVGALIANFRSSIPSPSFPLFTLHRPPRGEPVQNSGPSGLLVLSREALSSSTPCRFIPAHHPIFFPPRLEVVVEEQNPDRFPSHAWDQSALHRFLGYQSHGPAGAALWRVTAHHGDDPLLLAVFQNRRSAGPLLVVERGFEATRLVTMADLPNRLWREWEHRWKSAVHQRP